MSADNYSSHHGQFIIFIHSFYFIHVISFISDGSSDEGMSGLGSPSDPCMSPLAWSVTGKYLASAMEKLVNIWQVNGNIFVFVFHCSLLYFILC